MTLSGRIAGLAGGNRGIGLAAAKSVVQEDAEVAIPTGNEFGVDGSKSGSAMRLIIN